MPQRASLPAVFLLTVCLLTLATCGHKEKIAENIRRVTYPSDFTYVTDKQISPPMLKMGRELRALNLLLRARTEAPDQEGLRAVALGHLAAIEAAARDLENQTGWQSNHPGLKGNLSRLRSDVRSAQREIESDPPGYFLAGSVSGACLYCHGGR